MGISENRAREIAIAHVSANKQPDWLGIGEMQTYENIPWRKPIIYGVDFSNCWIAYVERKPFGLPESYIIAIDRDSGDIVYSGGAKDEG